ncbi:MAG: glycine zipper domain-containing protein [Candidatus Omnitrophica bacterium]|nr:glycine zipper domain-containing protein [Candidatus Omnitrophota bacterium]
MKKYLSLSIALIFALAILGCETNKTRVAEGAGIGGAVGALAGGIIGHQSGNAVGGALIGGAVGAGAGALVGAQIDKPTTQTTQNAPAGQLTLQQVVDLTKQGSSGDDIIAKIKATNSKYSLTPDDIAYLKKEGVSQRVIEKMQSYK